MTDEHETEGCRPYCVAGPCEPGCLRMDDPNPIEMKDDRKSRTAARIRTAREGLDDSHAPNIPLRRAAEIHSGLSAPTAREMALYAEACGVSMDWLLVGMAEVGEGGQLVGVPQSVADASAVSAPPRVNQTPANGEAVLGAVPPIARQVIDDPDLRTRIRRALAEADGYDFDSLEPHDYQDQADKLIDLIQTAPIRLDVHCDSCKGLIGTWHGRIAEKYPFWCDNCGDIRSDKNPWAITATVEGAAT